MLDIRTPLANTSARSAVLTRYVLQVNVLGEGPLNNIYSLYADLVNDSLTEFSYDADLAGLSYNLFSHSNGLYMTMNGYNDKMAVLVQDILEKLKHTPIDENRLSSMKEQAQREWRNFFLGQSYTLSDYYARYIMTETQWTIEEKLKELPST